MRGGGFFDYDSGDAGLGDTGGVVSGESTTYEVDIDEIADKTSNISSNDPDNNPENADIQQPVDIIPLDAFVINLTTPGSGTGYTYSGTTLTFSTVANNHTYTLFQTDTTRITRSIVFPTDVTTTVTLQNINIAGTMTLQGNANITFLLSGNNTISGSINVSPSNTATDNPIIPSLTIDSASAPETGSSVGSITVTTTAAYIASIGGISGYPPGNITIKGGTVNATCGSNGGAGIGGGHGGNGVYGAIVISGGTVKATGGNNSAGIGSANNQGDSIITITGGEVTAQGGINGAGIGGGHSRYGQVYRVVTITGGKVTATGGVRGAGIGGAGSSLSGTSGGEGGTILIDGGVVVANGGQYAAGIGGGGSSDVNGGSGGNIKIENGDVTAQGGQYAAGIGGGNGQSGGGITIQGGEVIATGGDRGAGIGGGGTDTSGAIGGTGGTITITGGTVKAIGRNSTPSESGGAGIGGGSSRNATGGSGGIVTIEGGEVTAQGGRNSAGIGGGGASTFSDQPGFASGVITIVGGTIEATGGANSAGIGGGYPGGAGGEITIERGAVKAIGSGGGSGIGGGGNNEGGVITIKGGEIIAQGSADSSGIGGGGGGNNPGGAGGAITIDGGTVVAIGSGNGAGIGGGGTVANSVSGAGGIITIKSGTVVATGSGTGAGVGGGGTGTNNGGAGGTITIEGGTVIATGGVNDAAGIGGGSQGAGATLSIGSEADVKAYSSSETRPAIHAANSSNNGDGYYFNVYLPSVISATAATDIYVFPDGYSGSDLLDNVGILELPANYRCFAYTCNDYDGGTGDPSYLNAYLYADLGYSNSLGHDDIRVIDRVSDSSRQIPYVDDDSVLPVKLRISPVIPTTSTTGIITKTSATFISTGQDLNGSTYVSGGFRYSTTLDGDGKLAGTITTVTWSGGFAGSVSESTGDVLTPNTRYYLISYFIVDTSIWFGSGADSTTVESAVTSFMTPPDITNASVSQKGNESANISATFSGGNREITSVVIYWDTDPIDINSPSSAAYSKTLGGSEYTINGFTNVEIGGTSDPMVTATYNIVIQIVNEDINNDRYQLTYSHSAAPQINVSVPVKLIFAAFESDYGDITAPNYYITNNGETEVTVSLEGFTVDYDAGLYLVGSPVSSDEICLYINSKDTTPMFASVNLGLFTSPVSLGVLSDGDATDGSNKMAFTLTGDYVGVFVPARYPIYNVVFEFEVVGP